MKRIHQVMKKALVRMMLCLFLGRVDKPYLLAIVTRAGNSTINPLTFRAAVYRNLKADYGHDLSFHELNLVTDLTIMLSDVEKEEPHE